MRAACDAGSATRCPSSVEVKVKGVGGGIDEGGVVGVRRVESTRGWLRAPVGGNKLSPSCCVMCMFA
eukprot:6207889-Pleurochrysis_carterae.AAC.1